MQRSRHLQPEMRLRSDHEVADRKTEDHTQCTSELRGFGGFLTTVSWVSGRSEGMRLKFSESSGADAELLVDERMAMDGT